MSSFVSVVVADHAPTRTGVKLALDGHAVVCAEASDADGAVRAVLSKRPDVCLIGTSIAGGGIAAARRICELVPETAVVMLAASENSGDLLDSLRAGAVGYVPVGFDAPQLRRVVSVVAANETAVPRSMVRDLIDELRAVERASEDRLTAREAQILTMLNSGHSTAGIAAGLDISPVTVRRHISKLVQKVGASDRSDLVGVPTARRAQLNGR
jgi:DNA-binding NarL/FixJ family response regulator